MTISRRTVITGIAAAAIAPSLPSAALAEPPGIYADFVNGQYRINGISFGSYTAWSKALHDQTLVRLSGNIDGNKGLSLSQTGEA